MQHRVEVQIFQVLSDGRVWAGFFEGHDGGLTRQLKRLLGDLDGNSPAFAPLAQLVDLMAEPDYVGFVSKQRIRTLAALETRPPLAAEAPPELPLSAFAG